MTYILLHKCTLKNFLGFNFIYLGKKEIYTLLRKAT